MTRTDISAPTEMSGRLNNHDAALGGRVLKLFYVRAMTCCMLDNGFLVGCQTTERHGNLEVVLAKPEDLSVEFTTGRDPGSPLMTQLLRGRKFRGLFCHARSGDVSLDFGRFRLRFNRLESVIGIEAGIEEPESSDLLEDGYLSIDEQIWNARAFSVGSFGVPAAKE